MYFRSNVSGKPKDEIFEKIKLLGRLYDYTMVEDRDAPFEFQSFLDKYDSDRNTHDRIEMLKRPCHELLSDCSCQSQKRNCSDLFVTELTMEGHCCVFNYISQSTSSLSEILYELKF
ncbi:hypothetical protein NQ314_007041 [Rhamnusium bicolor]|uniref:Uncharacterized protein n=1 Tax=Rhamnusium bicolor TaxID=1586634 RepID=A0AAV8YSA4_9CUCU|nr:hypothetical protein NQ314_007041 [Rhamnusium bicolor]